MFAADQVSPLFIAVDDLPKLPYAELLLTTVVLTPADHVHHHQYLQEPVGPGHLLLADHLADPTHPLLHHYRRGYLSTKSNAEQLFVCCVGPDGGL